MFIKIVLVFVSILFISFLKYSEPYYFLCKAMVDNKSNTILPLLERPSLDKEKFESFNHTCHNVYTDYSNHTVMKYTINNFIKVFYSERKYSNIKIIENIINKTELGDIQLILALIKLIFLFVYVSLLYLIIVIMPSKLVNLILSIMNKVLYVFFEFLLVEGIIRVYLNIDMDIIHFIETHRSQVSDFMPVYYIIHFFKSIFNWLFRTQ